MNYHGQIMNIPIKIGKQITALNESIPDEHTDIRDAAIKAYARGHRDARHDAAEIVLSGSDKSDKELFDAQLISNLKKQIEDMHTALLQNSDAMHYLRNRVKELEYALREGIHLAKIYGDIDMMDAWWRDAENLLPKEKQE